MLRRRRWVVPLALSACLAAGCQPGAVPTSMQTDPGKAVVEAKIAILQAVDHDDPVVRARAAEAVARFLAREHGSLLVSALDDPQPGPRTVAALAIGDIRYAPAKPRLTQMMTEDRKVGERYWQVIPAVIYALHRLGNDEYLSWLGQIFYRYDTVLIRRTTAEVLGKIGNPEAIEPLKRVMWREQEKGTQLAFDEALASLGDPAAKARLESYTQGRFLDIRIQAAIALAEHNPNRAKVVLMQMYNRENDQPALRLTAAGLLARLGAASPSRYRFALRALRDPGAVLAEATNVPPEEGLTDDMLQLIRRQAIWALAWMKQRQAVDVLVGYLDSPDPSTRVLAAMSIFRLLPDAAPAPTTVPAEPIEPEQAESREEPEEPMVPQAPAPRRPRLHTSGAKE